MLLIAEIELDYVNHLDRPAAAHVRVFRNVVPGGDGSMVVIFEPPDPDYQGLSVTNGCELIVSRLVNGWAVAKSHAIWIEHYPAWVGFKEKESFDWVIFSFAVKRGQCGKQVVVASRPKWKSITREEVEVLIGGELKGRF
jgi:hypothetical protein